MCAGAKAFFDCADGSLDFTNVAIGGNNVEMSRRQGQAGAFKFIVAVYVADGETADGVKLDHSCELVDDGFGRAIRDENDGAETDVARDCV